MYRRVHTFGMVVHSNYSEFLQTVFRDERVGMTPDKCVKAVDLSPRTLQQRRDFEATFSFVSNKNLRSWENSDVSYVLLLQHHALFTVKHRVNCPICCFAASWT